MDGNTDKKRDRLLSYLHRFHSKLLPNRFFSRQLVKNGSISAAIVAARSLLASSSFSGSDTQSHLGALVEPRLGTSESQKVSEDLLWLDGSQSKHLGFYSAEYPRSILCFEDAEYPALLREIHSPPPILYVLGDAERLKSAQLAVVGSRKSSAYGVKNATWMSRELSAFGLSICSGLAMGIDAAAHRGALESGGTTVAVVAHGLDRVYPRRNHALFTDIVNKRGAIVSEFPLATPPKPEYFPQRNRIISGSSLATLVIEAKIKSGSLITARLAIEQNRDVFAVPGSIHTTAVKGCHWLIKQGALLVESPGEVIEALAPQLEHLNFEERRNGESERASIARKSKDPKAHHSPEEQLVLTLLEQNEYTLDALVSDSRLAYEKLVTALARLESRARIGLVGGRYRVL